MQKSVGRAIRNTLLATSLLCLAWSTLTTAQEAPQEKISQAELEQQLDEVQQGIRNLQKNLLRSRGEQEKEQVQLRNLDLAIQQTSRQLRELDARATLHLARLAELEIQKQQQLQVLHDRQELLASQVAATYKLSRQSRMKLVLNQDKPAELSRMLAYFDHINRAQLERIATLKEFLAEIELTFTQIDQELAEVETLKEEQNVILELQNGQRDEREAVILALQSQISSEEDRLAELDNNRKDLERILEQLNNVFADIPADLGKQLGVADQKGQLPMPVGRKVLHAYGQQRAVGVKWQGWLIDAPAGAEVRNIAYGRVAFADWLRGYGLMLIIDHGQGYMSLYGYNESLLWDVGDWLEPGEVIATVGNNPGGEQGLYFELRKEGTAVDPAAWINRK